MIGTKWTRLAIAGLLGLAITCSTGPRACAQQSDAAAGDSPLPLHKVVMYNSGVGYFEHSGDVTGDAKVDLKFRVDDVNDLLKSMILEDRGGGKISTVSYGSRDPITRTLKTFPIDLTNNPTLGAILDQVRGERVQLEAPTEITGILLGVERRKKEVGKDQTIEVEFLNLLTDAGLRSVPMESISRIKLVNEKLDADLRQALQVLATGHNTDKKSVTLNLNGQGKRPVRVGYIQATPVWKTSYRLVLSDKEPPFLQGWAIVENTTEGDWNNVELTLVSGRPISFTMDLYEPLFAQRPLEKLNLFASLRPQTYGDDLATKEKMFSRLSERDTNGQPVSELAADNRGSSLARRGKMAAPAPYAPGVAGAMAPAEGVAFDAASVGGSAAQGGDVGELFQYVIGAPVTLARQKSAMLPIVNTSVKGEKVSIYNPAVQAKHPLNGLKLVNSTDLHLMQGPITVFDGAYAGDAKIEDLAPKAERLISYALDLKTEVAPESKHQPAQLLSVKIAKGTMHIVRKLERTQHYTIKNSDTKPKTVLVEYPYDPNWKLVAPEKPTEKTRDMYRFTVKAEPGKPAELTVQEEQTQNEQVAVSTLNNPMIAFYLSEKSVSPEVKAALQEVVKRKQVIEQVVQQRTQREQEIAAITQEQERIRQNMTQLDRNTDLYKRYVQKFGTQEDTVEKTRTEIQKLTTEENRLKQELDKYLIGLNI